jgi:acetylornithine deacetylase/succinyl-diaminopimelate desuccinylase-like protein
LNALPQLRTGTPNSEIEIWSSARTRFQTARATVNRRLLPGQPVADVEANCPPSALHAEIMQAIENLTGEFWPGIPVGPTMGPGATDGAYLRNAGIPTYGHSGLADDVDDFRAHGKDERVLVKSFFDGNEYLYRLVKLPSRE